LHRGHNFQGLEAYDLEQELEEGLSTLKEEFEEET